jgi:hypothetical protein
MYAFCAEYTACRIHTVSHPPQYKTLWCLSSPDFFPGPSKLSVFVRPLHHKSPILSSSRHPGQHLPPHLGLPLPLLPIKPVFPNQNQNPDTTLPICTRPQLLTPARWSDNATKCVPCVARIVQYAVFALHIYPHFVLYSPGRSGRWSYPA